MDIGHETIVVLFDPATGEIVHVSHVLSERGANHPDEATLEKDALAEAARVKQRRSPMPSKPGILHVRPGSFERRVAYRVDVQKRALVKTPPR